MNEDTKQQEQKGNGVLPCVSGSDSDWRKPLIDRVKYELRKYTELAKRMDELLDECNLEAKYDEAREAEIKRNCYNKIVNDLKLLAS
jgi:hypothetical protein